MDSSTDRRAVDIALLVVRVVLGVIFTIHGSQLMFGAFGGPGLQGTASFMGPVGYLVAIGQFFGGLGIVLGILTRFSAAAIIVIMIGAILQVHLKNGFFNTPPNLGYEYNLALIGLALAILIAGPGRFTLARPLPFLGGPGEPPATPIE